MAETKPDFMVYIKEPQSLAQFEHNGYQNLKDPKGNIHPIFRVVGKRRAEEDNQDPERTLTYQKSRRRTPRSASPLVDMLLELHHMFYFPEFPSRQHAHFANLHGYQSRYLKDGNAIFLILPHQDARIAISSVQDFRLTNPGEVLECIRPCLSKATTNADLTKLLDHKEEYEKADFLPAHAILDLLSCFKSWFEDPKSAPEAVRDILAYWPSAVSPQSLTDSAARTGSEVVVEGLVKFIEMDTTDFAPQKK